MRWGRLACALQIQADRFAIRRRGRLTQALFSCIQFWTLDSTEFAHAFTYGGNTMTQYPMTIFPREILKGLTFLVPVAFVNWYPCLYLLGRPDPFGMPSWFAVLPPLVAVLTLTVAGLAW